MAAGLPVLTSDFGNIGKYARASGGAICIDPTSYDAFESAITQLFQPALRRQLGEAGRSFVRREASFEREAAEYVEVMRALAAGRNGAGGS
jgi:glycosyltransferase involved in cell wall biosynthesis